ncbi:MAG: hypothetical protein MUF38_15465, partial [Anaerolineae bacterium]|nr:hypothetical protein [Anaerolineae bacterium]
MDVSTVAALIEAAQQGEPIEIWPEYVIRDIPFAVYDDQQVQYVNHPNPPMNRPANLMAATSTDINGVETATIPTWVCEDEQTALTIAYHEGFHVFQKRRFAPIKPNMFMAMAFYPDLDLDYRVLCRLEVEALLKTDWTAAQRLGVVGFLTDARRRKLDRHSSLLDYERFLEQNEGTAKYIEQKSGQQLFGLEPAFGEVGHGWARFYQVGAGICWLLDALVPGWTARIEAGATPGDIAVEHRDESFDIHTLHYTSVLAEESARLDDFRREIDTVIAPLENTSTLRIRYPSNQPIMRAFSPATLVSLGDGRILHRAFFKLLRNDRGAVSVEVPVIDNVANGEVVIPQR